MYLDLFVDFLLCKRFLLFIFECVGLRINDSVFGCLDKCTYRGRIE